MDVERDTDETMSSNSALLYRSVGAWVKTWGGNVPQHAVIGGQDYCDIIYVARANHLGDVMVGKLLPTHLCCYIPWNKQEIASQEYEVLCNPNVVELTWENSSDGRVPLGALQGGRMASGEPLFIGRHKHEGTVTVGSVMPSHHCLYIPFGGREIGYNDYEVLICKTLTF